MKPLTPPTSPPTLDPPVDDEPDNDPLAQPPYCSRRDETCGTEDGGEHDETEPAVGISTGNKVLNYGQCSTDEPEIIGPGVADTNPSQHVDTLAQMKKKA